MMLRASTLTAGFALAGAALTFPAPATAQHGVNPAYIDTTCSPCSDFFAYANGAWLKTAAIPAAYAGTGAARELFDRNTEKLRRVLEGAAASADTARDPTLRKLWL
jgi:putative endopeptidase